MVGEELTSLDLTSPTHTEINNYPDDSWSFTDVTGNYSDANGTVNDEITLRAISITADAKSKLVGQADPVLTFRITGGTLLSVDTISGGLIRLFVYTHMKCLL